MSFDVELCESEQQRRELSEDIRKLRASLLAEHAGSGDVELFEQTDSLIALIDQLCEDSQSKLWEQELERPEVDERFLIAFCDPAQPLDWCSVQDAVGTLFDSDQTLVKGAARRVGQRLGVVDISEDSKRGGASEVNQTCGST